MKKLKIMTNKGKNAILDMTTIQEFKNKLHGVVVLPQDESYERLRRIWNGMIDKHPGLIIQCTGVADVMNTVKFGRKHDLKVSIRGGGHNVAGHAISESGMVIDLSQMKSVYVDPEKRTARAEAGVTLGDLDHETHAFGLAVPVGLVSATGVAGLTLHGGIGWLSRRHGLSIDNLTSVDVVTADGKFLKANSHQNTDLFWAVKGGGGNFGIVTSFEFRLHPVGPQVWLAMTLYSADKASAALRFFRDYIATAPEELGALAVFWSAPDEPPIPKESQGKPVVIFLACYTGDFEKGEQVIKPLREFDTPIIDHSGAMPFNQVQKSLDADYPDGRLYYWKSLYLQGLDDETIEAIINHAAERPSPITSLDVWALGGKIAQNRSSETAFAQRKAPFLLGIESNWDNPKDSAKNITWTRKVFNDMKKFSTGGSYLNFPGFFEEGEELLQGAYGNNYERLQQIKAKYDPDNFFKGNLNIKPKF
jgi:hypothetical protein